MGVTPERASVSLYPQCAETAVAARGFWKNCSFLTVTDFEEGWVGSRRHGSKLGYTRQRRLRDDVSSANPLSGSRAVVQGGKAGPECAVIAMPGNSGPV